MPITHHATSSRRTSVALAALFVGALTTAAPSTTVLLGWCR